MIGGSKLKIKIIETSQLSFLFLLLFSLEVYRLFIIINRITKLFFYDNKSFSLSPICFRCFFFARELEKRETWFLKITKFFIGKMPGRKFYKKNTFLIEKVYVFDDLKEINWKMKIFDDDKKQKSLL